MQEKILNCPVCNKTVFNPYMEVKDHFLSGKIFPIVQCGFCGFKFINPRPDETEISEYYQSDEYISHDASKKDILSMIYRIARFFSLKGKIGIVSKFSKKGNILDIGCGTGEFLKLCQSEGFSVTGMEPGEKARSFAIEKNKIPVVERLDILKEKSNFYTTITLWHVLEHIHHLNEALEIIGNILSRDGTLIIAVPNYQSPDATYYGKFWAAYDVPRHLYHFDKDTMKMLLTRHGFHLVATLPQRMDAFYVSMLSEKYRTGQNQFVKSIWRGLQSNIQAKAPQKGYSSQIFILKKENR